jgi:hypothetical protein
MLKERTSNFWRIHTPAQQLDLFQQAAPLALCVAAPAACISLQGLIAASDLYGEGYVDMDEFLAAMVANSSYSKTKDAVSRGSLGRIQ